MILVTEARLDAQLFSGLIRYMDSKGYRPHSRCEALSAAVEWLIDILQHSGAKLVTPETEEQAMSFLTSYFGTSMVRRKNARRVHAREQLNIGMDETGISNSLDRPVYRRGIDRGSSSGLEDDMANWTPEQKHEFLRKAIEAANTATGAREQYVSDESKPISEDEFADSERAEIDRQKAFFADKIAALTK